MERIAFSVDEAAESAGVGQTKLREEIRQGRLVARKVGKRTIITAPDLEAWAAQLPKHVQNHDEAPQATLSVT
jgi:excisionase family DNA binding protein